MKLKDSGAIKARLMSDYIDITIDVAKLDENKLDTFIVSVVRAEKKNINYEGKNPNKIKTLFKKLLQRNSK